MKVDHFSHAALWHRVFRIFGIAAVILLVAGLLLSPSTTAANPDHSAGEYFMFAKAAATGVGDRKANEPTCDNRTRDAPHPKRGLRQARHQPRSSPTVATSRPSG